MIRKLKNVFIVLAMFIIAFAGYVMIVNRNSSNMTGRQKILKTLYPVLAWVNKLTKKNMDVITHAKMSPPVSFFSLKTVANDGSVLEMGALKGKKILLVNTASACGYTPQYEQLQKLYTQYNHDLVVIGFPANDFKEQERGSDAEIASFCQKNFGVSFPLAQKAVVVKAPNQNIIFQWLTNPAKNGWNSQPPTWNFSKYLVNEEGMLTHYFAPGVEPLSKDVVEAIQKK
ncbi:MAG: glutathione peroxidase [Chitinophagaceae bacterium]